MVALTSCSMDPAIMAGVPLDLLNGVSTIRDIRRNPGDVGNIVRVMALVATVHKYAVLSAAQKRHVETVVARRYETMVTKEKKSLRPKYASKKAEVQKRGAAKVAAARQNNPNSAAKVEAETAKEVEKVDIEWEKDAKSSVAKNYGTDFAVPITNAEGKPVVAFASVKESGVSVSDNSYISDKPGNLAEGSKVKHGGKTYAVLD